MVSEQGLKNHIQRNEGRPCGILVTQELKKRQLSIHQDRQHAISNMKSKDLPSEPNTPGKNSRPHRKPLTTEEKKSLLRIHDTHLQDLKDLENPTSAAVKNTAKLFGSSETTVRRVLKEDYLFGDVKGSPYPRDTLSLFEKLSISQKDALRQTVHQEIKKCIDKIEGAQYPTTKSLHDAITLFYPTANSFGIY